MKQEDSFRLIKSTKEVWFVDTIDKDIELIIKRLDVIEINPYFIRVFIHDRMSRFEWCNISECFKAPLWPLNIHLFAEKDDARRNMIKKYKSIIHYKQCEIKELQEFIRKEEKKLY